MKNGQQIGKEYVEVLRSYLEAHKETLPRLADGTLNKSALARAAGLDRQIFVSNPGAKLLLEQYGARPTRRRPGIADEDVRELLRKKDAEISRLRDLVAKRELELVKLRSMAQATRQLQAMHDLMVETMRHVKPLP